MRRLCLALILLAVAGCAKPSSLLMERSAIGPLEEEKEVARGHNWQLDPAAQNLTVDGVDVYVNYASREYLTNLFQNRKIFGQFAGGNPYYPEHLVFYVKITNQGSEKVYINQSAFVLLDDRGNQYATLGADPIQAFAESKQPWATTTRGLLSDARPGYFGFSFPVGKMLVGDKPQGRFALLKLAALQSGFLHPGVVTDGLIAFWSPSTEAKTLKLLITNVKTEFNPKDEPQKSLDFPFTFTTGK